MNPFKSSGISARFLVKGGVITPSYLLQIIDAARSLGIRHLHLGSRQDILLQTSRKKADTLAEKLKGLDLQIIYRDRHHTEQNIVSSYVTSGILPSTPWLAAGTYLNILDGFEQITRCKINIVDPKQNLIPLFYGELNFIASSREHYWYLYIRNVSTGELYKWPVLVYTNDIASLSKFIEEKMPFGENFQLTKLFTTVNHTLSLHNVNIDRELTLPEGFFHEYEGIYRMQSGNYWAGFYWRNNCYTLDFLEEVCRLCLQTNIARICFTPWKTFIVKDIKEGDLKTWDRLIGRYGINMRHSSLELNWHLPLLDHKAYKLKQYIVQRLDKIDVRTSGLTYAIDGPFDNPLTSVMIRSMPGIRLFGLSLLRYYSIYYARNFNPNSNKYLAFASHITRDTIPAYLVELCKRYYSLQSIVELGSGELSNEHVKKLNPPEIVYRCKHCFTQYSEQLGDISAGIAPGTAFTQIQPTYCCPVCDAPRSEFESVFSEPAVL